MPKDKVIAKADASQYNSSTKTNYLNMTITGYKFTDNIKKNKKAISNNKHKKFGTLNFSIKKKNNKRVFSLGFTANNLAEQNNIYSKTYIYEIVIENANKNILDLFDTVTTPGNNFSYLQQKIVNPLVSVMMNYLNSIFSENSCFLYLPDSNSITESKSDSFSIKDWQGQFTIACSIVVFLAGAAAAFNTKIKEIFTQITTKASAVKEEIGDTLVDDGVISSAQRYTLSAAELEAKSVARNDIWQFIVDSPFFNTRRELMDALNREMTELLTQFTNGELTKADYDLAVEELRLDFRKFIRPKLPA